MDRFLFAINTISMVKNDALFSYIAPANILAWIFIPLRYVMPIRRFVLLNRTVIKVTHWPILFLIFVYEKYYLALSIYEPTDLVENSGRGKGRAHSIAGSISRTGLFSPNLRTREGSIAGYQKDQALDEVFRRQPDANTVRTQRRQERRKTQTAIRNWMDQSDEIGQRLSRWPTIDSRPTHSLRRMSINRDLPRRFRTLSDVRSAASDPADLISNNGFPPSGVGVLNETVETGPKDFTDADGDDELVTNDEDYDDEVAGESRQESTSQADAEGDYFTAPMASRLRPRIPSSADSANNRAIATMSPGGPARRHGLHNRTLSTNTILYNPQEASQHGPSPPSISEDTIEPRSRPKTSRVMTTIEQSSSANTRSPRRTIQYRTENSVRPRPIPRSTLSRTALLTIDPRGQQRKPPSSVGSDNSGLLVDTDHDLATVPASFSTQMAMATGQLRGLKSSSYTERERENADRMSRLVLVRMKTLEESFANVAREVQLMRSAVPTAQNSADEASPITGSHKAGIGLSAQSRATRETRGQRRTRPWSANEERVGMKGRAMELKVEGKGKNIIKHDDAECEDEPPGKLSRRGSSL